MRTLEFQPWGPGDWGPCGSPGAGWRPWPPLDPPFRLHARPGKAVFCTRLHAPEVHPAPASVTTGGSSLSQLPPNPQKNVSLRRSCGACLRRPCGAGVRPLKHPEVPRGRLRRAPPDPAVPCPLPPLSVTPPPPRHARGCSAGGLARATAGCRGACGRGVWAGAPGGEVTFGSTSNLRPS
jgi:hypothetical protein